MKQLLFGILCLWFLPIKALAHHHSDNLMISIGAELMTLMLIICLTTFVALTSLMLLLKKTYIDQGK